MAPEERGEVGSGADAVGSKERRCKQVPLEDRGATYVGIEHGVDHLRAPVLSSHPLGEARLGTLDPIAVSGDGEYRWSR